MVHRWGLFTSLSLTADGAKSEAGAHLHIMQWWTARGLETTAGLVMVSHHVLQESKDERDFGQQDIFSSYNGITTRLYGQITHLLLNKSSCMKILHLSLSVDVYVKHISTRVFSFIDCCIL